MNAKVRTATCGALVALGVAAGVARGNSAPVVTNVSASQRTDGTKIVDIQYDLADDDGDACTVSMLVSADAGATWSVPVTAVSGAVGPGVTPGTGRLIIWDCKADLPGAFGSQHTIRVCADDGQAPLGMVLIPAGEFQMGDTFNEGAPHGRELPVHAVYTDTFYMDRCEVTNQQYAEALNWAYAQGSHITVTGGVVYKYNTGTSYPYCSTTSAPTSPPHYGQYSRITWNGSTFGVVSGKENHPMVMVSWYGSVAYANWRSAMEGRPLGYNLSTWSCNFNSGYRLPTEAEWEKAARGGEAGKRFPWSDTNTIQHARANYYSSWSGGQPYYSYDTSPTQTYHPLWGVGSTPYTSPVGFFTGALQYKADWGWPGAPTSYQTTNGANGYGLYDMAGNVGEWCNDWYSTSTYYSSSPYNNPRGPTSGSVRVLRGGGWSFIASGCRVANRSSNYPDGRNYSVGFRCVAGTADTDCGDSGLFTIDNGAGISAWASVQHHGPAGPNQELGIPLVEGADTVECRQAGVQHLIRVELNSTAGAPTITGTVQVVDQNTGATFDAASSLADNGVGSYTLDLVFSPALPTALDAPNVHGCYRIDLAPNIASLTGNTDMRFRVVVGDVSEDGQTLLNDFALVKLRAQQLPFDVDPGSLADIRKDLSHDGQFVLNDAAICKLNQFNGRSLVCP